MSDRNNIPKHWKVTTLGELAFYFNGRAFKPIEWEKEGLPIIRIQNLNNPESGYNYTKLNFEKRYKITKGDLLYAWSASLGAYIWKGGEAWLNQHIFKVVPHKDCDKIFLFYLLDRVTSELYAKSHGSGMVHVTKGKFEETIVRLPPFYEQQKIVAKIEELLSELDKGKEQLETAQQQLKVYRQAVLKWAFQGKLTAAWRGEQKQEVGAPGKQWDEGLPEGWRWARLGETMESVRNGYSKKPDENGDFKILRISSVRPNKVNIDEYRFLKNQAGAENSIEENDLLFTRYNGSIDYVGVCGRVPKLSEKLFYPDKLIRCRPRIKDWYHSAYLDYAANSRIARQFILSKIKTTAGQTGISGSDIKKIPIPFAPLKEQQQIVQEIEGRLSVCDKIEETITASLQQAETLRQSILKKAFEGKLIKPVKQPVVKPANDYFLQIQMLGLIVKASKQKNIRHGEMTIAKYAYLADKIYGIPTHYQFERLHLGPYPPEMKKAIKNQKFFTVTNGAIELVDEETLLKYNNPYREKIEAAVAELAGIFLKYSAKERPHKTELLATVCKVVEDIKSIDFQKVRQSMLEWKIDLLNSLYNNKAEKFTGVETKKCLEFMVEKGWDKKLIF